MVLTQRLAVFGQFVLGDDGHDVFVFEGGEFGVHGGLPLLRLGTELSLSKRGRLDEVCGVLDEVLAVFSVVLGEDGVHQMRWFTPH